MVIYPDASMKLYTSLRKIEEDILVHSSSISEIKEEIIVYVYLKELIMYFI